MADLSITAANVAVVSGTVRHERAGATVEAGEVVYRAAATKKMGLADCDSATAEVREPYGIAVNGASDNQPIAILTDGDVIIGATLTPGVAYYLSATAGKICPVADLGSGDYPSLIGIAKSATVLSVKLNASGVAL